jgi:hypothetical protein
VMSCTPMNRGRLWQVFACSPIDLPGLIDPNNFSGSNDRPYRSFFGILQNK